LNISLKMLLHKKGSHTVRIGYNIKPMTADPEKMSNL